MAFILLCLFIFFFICVPIAIYQNRASGGGR